jgi:hypothetical protein
LGRLAASRRASLRSCNEAFRRSTLPADRSIPHPCPCCPSGAAFRPPFLVARRPQGRARRSSTRLAMASPSTSISLAMARSSSSACTLGCILSKRLGSAYRAGRVDCWLKIKNPTAPAIKREAEEDWGKRVRPSRRIVRRFEQQMQHESSVD